MIDIASIPWIEAIPFWVLLSIGLVLIGIDVYLTSDNHLMWVGVSVIVVSISSALHLPGEIQVLVFAASLFGSMIYVRKLVARIPRVEHQASSVVNLHDAMGVVLNVNEASPGEGRAAIQNHGEWRFVCERKDHALKPGERVRVVGREGLVVIVEPAPR